MIYRIFKKYLRNLVQPQFSSNRAISLESCLRICTPFPTRRIEWISSSMSKSQCFVFTTCTRSRFKGLISNAGLDEVSIDGEGSDVGDDECGMYRLDGVSWMSKLLLLNRLGSQND